MRFRFVLGQINRSSAGGRRASCRVASRGFGFALAPCTPSVLRPEEEEDGVRAGGCVPATPFAMKTLDAPLPAEPREEHDGIDTIA